MTDPETAALIDADQLGHALWRLRGALAEATAALAACSTGEHDHAGGECPTANLSVPEREIARLGLQIMRDSLAMTDAALGTTP